MSRLKDDIHAAQLVSDLDNEALLRRAERAEAQRDILQETLAEGFARGMRGESTERHLRAV